MEGNESKSKRVRLYTTGLKSTKRVFKIYIQDQPFSLSSKYVFPNYQSGVGLRGNEPGCLVFTLGKNVLSNLNLFEHLVMLQ